MVQWLGICASTAGDVGSISSGGTMIPDAVLYGKKTKQKLFGEVKSCQYVLKNRFFLALLFFVFGCPVQREGSLVPGPGIEPTPPAMELQCPRHWTAQEAPPLSFLSIKSKSSKLFAGVTLHFKLDIYRILNLILKWYLPRPPEVRYEREQMKNNKLTFV